MATTRIAQNDNCISKMSTANIVLIILSIIAISITIVQYTSLESLRTFKSQQDAQSDEIEKACDWMKSNTAKYANNYDSTKCEDAINRGRSYGVVGQICEKKFYEYTTAEDYKYGNFRFLYQQEPNATIPSEADDSCELAADKLERLKAEAYIIPACDSVDKIDSQECKSAQARFNGKFTPVLCYGSAIKGFPGSFKTYLALSKDIYDGKWHYEYSSIDFHANEQCTW